MKHPRVLEVLPLAPNCLPQGVCGHTRLTQNVLRHYIFNEPLNKEATLSYYQPNNSSSFRKNKSMPNISYIIPIMVDKSFSDFIEKAELDGAEVIIPSLQVNKSFEENVNAGAEEATGGVLCVVDIRKNVNYSSAFKLASQLINKDGLIGTCLNIGYSRPYLTGECIAVSRRAYEECGLFNLNMLSGELNYLELNLRYAKKHYACRSSGLLQQEAIPDRNFDRNAKYIHKVYGIKV
jgi:hypothetical protein